MADIALVTAGRVSLVAAIGGAGRQLTLPAAEAITAGAPMFIDGGTGKWKNALGTTAATPAQVIAQKSAIVGEPVTGIEIGVLDGYDLSTLAYGAPVYLSDTSGRLSTTAGTVSQVVGRVIPAFATPTGTAPDKLLEVRL